MEVEAKIIQFLQSNASSGWIVFFMSFTMLAGFAGLLFFGLIIFLKDKKMTISFALSYGFTALFNLILKTIIQRPRPFDSYSGIFNYGQEDGYSMPSSHSAIAAMTAVFLSYLAFKKSKSWTVRILTIVVMTLFVAMIALSRMVLGVHYISDTAVGIVEGVAIGLIGIKADSSIKIVHEKSE